LDALRAAAVNNRIGEVFLEYVSFEEYTYLFSYVPTGANLNFILFSHQQSAFMIYSTYCNSYSRALMELESYTGNKEATTILEK
jgi:Rho guanine nucleotide exchange factor 4/29